MMPAFQMDRRNEMLRRFYVHLSSCKFVSKEVSQELNFWAWLNLYILDCQSLIAGSMG